MPFTRAGCDVGQVASANAVLENTATTSRRSSGRSSPEAQQLAADPDSFKDAEVADYVGIGVHCAQGAAFCADAKGARGNQTTVSPTAVSDLLADEPGGATGSRRCRAPVRRAASSARARPTWRVTGIEVTNAAGNLVDENGNQINGAFLTNHPGFPGFGPINGSQSLAYMADMLESGVPVVNGYIADIDGNESIPGLAACAGVKANAALGSGDPCYTAQAQYYNQAFGTFFQRLAADGITPKNTLFVLSSDEGDHEAGANVGRAIQPSPANCDGIRLQGRLYCVGGVAGAEGTATSVTAAVYYAPLLSPGIGAWTASTPFPHVMSGPTCMTDSGYIYCLSANPDGSLAPEAYYASLSSNGVGAWTRTAAPPTRTEGCSSIGGYAYCFGGGGCPPDGPGSDCYSPSYFAPLPGGAAP